MNNENRLAINDSGQPVPYLETLVVSAFDESLCPVPGNVVLILLRWGLHEI